jgi:hypothetical protein
MGTPVRAVVAPAKTVAEPLKFGSVKWVGGAQLAGGAGKVVSRALVMPWTVMGTLRVLWTLKTAQRVVPG